MEGMCLKSICTSTFEDRRDHLRVLGKHIWQVRMQRDYSFTAANNGINNLPSECCLRFNNCVVFYRNWGEKNECAVPLRRSFCYSFDFIGFSFVFFYFLKTLKPK